MRSPFAVRSGEATSFFGLVRSRSSRLYAAVHPAGGKGDGIDLVVRLALEESEHCALGIACDRDPTLSDIERPRQNLAA